MTKKNHQHTLRQISGFDVKSNSGVEPGKSGSRLSGNFNRVLGKAAVRKKEHILNMWLKSNGSPIVENLNEDQENISTKVGPRPTKENPNLQYPEKPYELLARKHRSLPHNRTNFPLNQAQISKA